MLYSITNSLIEMSTPRESSFFDRIFLGKINGNNNYIMILYQQKANGLKQKALASDYSDQHHGLLFNLKSPVRIAGIRPMIRYSSFDFERKEVNETELTPLFSCSNLAFRSPE